MSRLLDETVKVGEVIEFTSQETKGKAFGLVIKREQRRFSPTADYEEVMDLFVLSGDGIRNGKVLKHHYVVHPYWRKIT
jgi:hypothetical protein